MGPSAFAPKRIVLVSMPWMIPNEPQLGLGILKACLSSASIEATVIHAAPLLLRWMTLETYFFLANSPGVNESLFTYPLCGLPDESQLACYAERARIYVRESHHSKYTTVQAMLDLFSKVREEIVPRFLNECASRILENKPSLVGFSCMFDQTLASVALAKIIKEQAPRTKIVFGGSALMGSAASVVTRSFHWVDAAVQGDGEAIIVALSRAALSNEHFEYTDPKNRIIKTARFPIESSPVPDYQDWFNDIDELSKAHRLTIRRMVLPVESSRGCWWGQHSHCIFCGIDSESMNYSHKQADTTLEMLRQLRREYGDHLLRFSDYIMPKQSYQDLLPALAAERPRFRLHSEVKANQTPERIKLMAAAGFVGIQPGIESFSTEVLQLMKKGVRGIDNVALLKYGYLNRLLIDYNILFGFPGEAAEWYRDLFAKVPCLYHLMPPITCIPVEITKFAPLQANQSRFGVSGRQQAETFYEALFSKSYCARIGFKMDDYAYNFRRNYEFDADLRQCYLVLTNQVKHWKDQLKSRPVELTYEEKGKSFLIRDSRFPDEFTHQLSGNTKLVYGELDSKPVSLSTLKTRLVSSGNMSIGELNSALQYLEHHRLVWSEGEFRFGLAVDRRIFKDHLTTKWVSDWRGAYAFTAAESPL